MPVQHQIQYDTARLDEQYPKIRKSRDKAVIRIYRDAYKRILGIKPGDPGELWKYALRKFASSSAPTAGRNPVLQCWRESLGTPSLETSLDVLRQRFAGRDTKLIAAIRKLLDLAEQPPVTDADLEAALDPTNKFLVQNWVAERSDPLFFQRSLSFFSDAAIAKVTHYTQALKMLPHYLWDSEAVRKRCSRLGLLPASPRIIKDFTIVSGRPAFVPFASRLAR